MASHAGDETVRTGRGASKGTAVGALLMRMRRHWWLVLAVTAVAVVGALVATATTPTTYVGRTSLIVSSNDRSPDQDAVLVRGYVVYFNDAAYQRQLLRSAGVPADVELTAESAAASPILIISATTSDPETAQAYAIEVADAFRDDINRNRAESRAEELVALQAQLDAALGLNTASAQALATDLQDRIDVIRGDQVNALQELQAQGGVTAQSPSLFANLLPALAGGLLLGVLAAVALAKSSRRLYSRQDVAEEVGLDTLVELPGTRTTAGRAQQEQRLGQLATIVRARLAGPGVVAVAEPEEGLAASIVARELAQEWAGEGYPTLLVTTDEGTVPDGAQPEAPPVRPGPVPGLSLLQLTSRSADGAPVLSVRQVSEVVGQEALAGQYVVIAAPGVVQSAAARAICQVADQTVLVLDTTVTRVPAAREAVVILRQLGARMMGAVLASALGDRDQEVPPVWSAPSRGPSEQRAGDAGQRSMFSGEHDRDSPVHGFPSSVSTRGAETGQE